MPSRIALVDVSALIYVGYYVSNDDSKEIEDTLRFPIAGARFAIRRLLGLKGSNDDVIAVMDSRTDKNLSDSRYKSNRDHIADIHIQKEYLKFLLPNIGIKVAVKENYEADDLIYSIVYSLPYDSYDMLTIITDDSDISGAIVNDKISRVGATSKTPTLEINNYTALVKTGKYLPYNSVLAYHFFYGKPSNNISSLSNSKTLFERFLKFVEANNIPDNRLSERYVMLMFCKSLAVSGELTSDDINHWLKRCDVIYPKTDGLKYNDIPDAKVDADIASTHLSMLRETPALTALKVPRLAPNAIVLSKFDKFVSMYRSGASLVDADVTADKGFMFTNEFEGDNTRSF